MTRTRIEKIGIATDTALRLGRYFGTTPDLWLNLQRPSEVETLARSIGPEVARIEAMARAAA